MPKFHKSDEWFTVERREEDQELVTIGILGATMEDIGSFTGQDVLDARSALYAGSDFMRHGRYDHELTQVGLHLFPEANLTNWRGTNLGVVSVFFTDPQGIGVPIPSEEDYPEGWAVLNRRNGRFYLSQINQEWRITRARKHDFVDGYLQGMGFNIRVLPWNINKNAETGMGAADYVLMSWLEDDDAKAAEIRIDGISRAQTRQQLNRPVRRLQRQGKNVGEVPEGNGSNGTPIMVVKAGSKRRFDITKLPHQAVVVINNRKQPVLLQWDGTYAARARFEEVARQGYPVKVSN